MKFEIDDLVDVVPFFHGEGAARRQVVPAFRGRVTRRFLNGSGEPCYNVLDVATGKAWHRSEDEMQMAHIVLPNAFTRALTWISLLALMCRKHKRDEISECDLHPWNREETSWQAGVFKPRIEQARAA